MRRFGEVERIGDDEDEKIGDRAGVEGVYIFLNRHMIHLSNRPSFWVLIVRGAPVDTRYVTATACRFSRHIRSGSSSGHVVCFGRVKRGCRER